MFIRGNLLGSRRHKFKYILVVLIFSTCVWWLQYVTSRVSNEPALEHFRRNRNLSSYLNSISYQSGFGPGHSTVTALLNVTDDIRPLITEPSSTLCDSFSDVPLLILVTSTAARYEYRDAIRATWALHFPTYFLLGLRARDEDAASIHLEAQQYNDLIVYDFQEHYQNLTLKTALMLKWTQGRCPSVGFLMKTDDDILVNPWMMANVVKENNKSQLIGFKRYDVWPYRDKYAKWYLPRWLFEEDFVPQYLLGAAYLINGKYVKKMLDVAAEVPLINIEDIYFTYLVAWSKLGLELTHDPRLSPYPHWFLLPCLYWPFAITHDLEPHDTYQLWSGLVEIATDYNNNKEVCSFYDSLSKLFKFFSM